LRKGRVNALRGTGQKKETEELAKKKRPTTSPEKGGGPASKIAEKKKTGKEGRRERGAENAGKKTLPSSPTKPATSEGQLKTGKRKRKKELLLSPHSTGEARRRQTRKKKKSDLKDTKEAGGTR